MREGVDREGNYLYPAFPYDHYTKATDADIDAIYAYLMTRRPVDATAPENDLPFPLNLRMTVAGWNLLYLNSGPYQPDTTRSETWNRGAYLVEGLGHCGSCHTPRNALGAEDEDRHFAGGFGEGWHGPALNGDSPAPVSWTAEQIATYLGHDWQEFHGTPLGPMAEVADNIRRMPQQDLEAIGTYIESVLMAENTNDREEIVAAAQEKSWTATQLASLESAQPGGENPGEATFAGACATCHFSGGDVPFTRPVELGLSTTVALDDPTNFLQVVVNGVHPRDGTEGAIMPGFGDVLDDGQIADLAAYVRSHFSEKPAWSDVAGTLDDLRQESGGT